MAATVSRYRSECFQILDFGDADGFTNDAIETTG